jgi:hypothetical protein
MLYAGWQVEGESLWVPDLGGHAYNGFGWKPVTDSRINDRRIDVV